MPEKVNLWLDRAEKTATAGASLVATLYTVPLTLLLKGDLGAGKTTFLQGFGSALGIKEPLTSPTYALEQRYRSPTFREFIHIDLYRVNPKEAKELLLQSDNFAGIRAIEWSDRAGSAVSGHTAWIGCVFEEERGGRKLTVEFGDIPLPSREQILAWREDVHLPAHVQAHCDAVAAYAGELANRLLAESTIVRTEALIRAAEVHDLFRFLDFRPGSAPPGIDDIVTPTVQERWDTLRSAFAGMKHEEACASFLLKHGFHALATIVKTHGLQLPSPDRTTIEQKLLYYADKRINVDRLVSLDERFDDFRKRYGGVEESDDAMIWYAEAQTIERELFGSDVP